MDRIIVSPIVQAAVGYDMNDNTFKIQKPDVVNEENIVNRNVVTRLVNRLLRVIDTHGDATNFGTIIGDVKDELYTIIVENVYSCRMFASRFIGRCYVTNKTYDDAGACSAHAFTASQRDLGDRWHFSAFPYHASCMELIPFVDCVYSAMTNLVPMVDFPNVEREKQFLIVNVKRSSGVIQQGMLKTDKWSMVAYRQISDDKKCLEPTGVVYFNNDCSDLDLDDNDGQFPFTDCTKNISVTDLIAHNPHLYNMFRIGDQDIPTFCVAMRHSIQLRCLDVLV
jgi:hypothetical protein